MRDQRPHNKKRYDTIVFMYSEGRNSTEIMEELEMPSSTYWRLLADGGGMPVWAKIDHLKNRRIKNGKNNG